jgi:hypothetical protein
MTAESRIERQMGIAVRFIERVTGRPDFGGDDNFAGNTEFRHELWTYFFIYICWRIYFDRVVIEIFDASVATIFCCSRSCSAT